MYGHPPPPEPPQTNIPCKYMYTHTHYILSDTVRILGKPSSQTVASFHCSLR